MKKQGLKINGKAAAVIAALLIIIVALSFTLSKYTGSFDSDHLQANTEFEFSSNLLTEDEAVINLYSRNPDTDYSFDIELRNWKDRLNISGVSFKADIETDCTDAALSQDSLTFGSAGTLTSDTITVTVPADTVITDNTITVTATVSKPYSKTISAQFVIHDADGSESNMIVNYGEYIDVHLDTQAGQAYTVVWPEGYSPDNTNAFLLSAYNDSETLGGGSYIIPAALVGNSLDLRFFKTGTVSASAVVSVTKQGDSTQTQLIPTPRGE